MLFLKIGENHIWRLVPSFFGLERGKKTAGEEERRLKGIFAVKKNRINEKSTRR